jgi:hypothetical protein
MIVTIGTRIRHMAMMALAIASAIPRSSASAPG